jgi:hypothetical protein
MKNLFKIGHNYYYLIFYKTFIDKHDSFRDDDPFDLLEIAMVEYSE